MRIIAPATWWLALQWADATPPCIICIGHGCQRLLRRNTDTEREFMGLSRKYRTFFPRPEAEGSVAHASGGFFAAQVNAGYPFSMRRHRLAK